MNAIWRSKRPGSPGKRVYRSKRYTQWIAESDALFLTQKRRLANQHIDGYFQAILVLDPPTNRHRDTDNFLKGPLDFAKRVNLIKDDHLSRDSRSVYGNSEDAPFGARLILVPM